MSEQLQLQREHTDDDEVQIKHSHSLEYLDEDEINLAIIRERNEGLRKIAEDMEHLSDISLTLKELVFEQAEPLEIAEQNIEKAEENVEEAVEHLEKAETLANKFRNIFAKGALVSTGVTGASAATGVFLNPIVGGVGAVIGIGGLVYCIIQMTI